MAADRAKPGGHGPGRGFRRDIEGLRGLAILLVVLYHAGVPGFTGGYTGVDVFFVLSGYLITGLLIREIEETGRLRFANFYARRARRLLPAACTVIVATLLVGRLIYPPVDHTNLARSGLATALYVSNFHFARSAIDYLADPGADPLLHTWSLAVEEQFYLFWPALVLLSLAGFRSTIRRARLAVAMVLLAVTSYALCVWVTGVKQPYAFFLLPTRAWEFAIGALACLISLRMVSRGDAPAASRPSPGGAAVDAHASGRTRIGDRGLHAASWLGFIAVMVAGMRFSENTVFPGAAAMLPVAGTGLMLVAGAANEKAGALRLMINAPMQWIGRLSYAWYLWHWPMLIYAHVFPSLRGPVAGVALSTISLGLAWLTHVLVENPVRFHKRLVRRPGLSLAVAAVLTLIGTGTAIATRTIGHRLANSPGQLAYIKARDLPIIYVDGCHLSIEETRAQGCEFGDTTSKSTLVLFGDSHAAQWFPALEQIARTEHLRLLSLTKSSCPAAAVMIRNVQLGRKYAECETWRNAAMQRIIAQRPVAVVMADFAGYITVPDVVERWTASADEWRAGVRRTVAVFDSANVRTILLEDTPRPGYDVPTCLARAAWNPAVYGSRCVFNRTWQAKQIMIDINTDVARSSKLARVVDLTDAICKADPCSTERDGFVLYRDAHHLTTRFAESLAPLLAERIFGPEEQQGPDPSSSSRRP